MANTNVTLPLKVCFVLVGIYFQFHICFGETKQPTGARDIRDEQIVSHYLDYISKVTDGEIESELEYHTATTNSKNEMESLHDKVNILNLKNPISLDVIQHEKVQLLFQPAVDNGEDIRFSLGSGEGVPRHTMDVNMYHADAQTSIVVHVYPASSSMDVLPYFSLLLGLFCLMLVVLVGVVCLARRTKGERRKQHKDLCHQKTFVNENEAGCNLSDCRTYAVVMNSAARFNNKHVHTDNLLNSSELDPTHPDNSTQPDHTRLSDSQAGSNCIKKQTEKLTMLADSHAAFDERCTFGSEIDDSGKPCRQKMQGTRKKSVEQVFSGFRWCILGFGGLLAVCAVIGLVNLKNSNKAAGDISPPVLTISVPEKALIRKIRSYSSQPDVKEVLFNNSESMSLVTRLQLLDFSPECKKNLSLCKTHAVCDTGGPGNALACRCRMGYYLDGLTCKACSTSCPVGHYMTTQCTAGNNVKCKPCSSCTGTKYTAAPCTTTKDTLCIDVSFPLDQLDMHRGVYYGGETIPRFSTDVNVSSSDNIFVQNVNNMKRLESQLYFSNNKQLMEYEWEQRQGLKIHIELLKSFLLPEYVDLDQETDIDFALRHRSYPQDLKETLRNVSRIFCRNPIPDEYELIVQIHRNVSVAARDVTCDARNAMLQQCPKGYEDGDSYVERQLDQDCPRGGNRLSFNSKDNHLFCADKPDVLRTIFRNSKQYISPVPRTYATEECKAYEGVCQSCLTVRSCARRADYDCCSLECSDACKGFYSPRCPPPPVECAQGDVTEMAVYPRFRTIQDKFMCHVMLKPPDDLYIVSYTASVPGLSLNLGERHVKVKWKSPGFHENGLVHSDYLTMEHFSQMPILPEAVLVKSLGANGTSKFTLHPLKAPEDFFKSSRFNIREDHRVSDKFKTSVQFERPFLYSAKTWKQGGCEKNVSQIYPSQPLYQGNGEEVKKTHMTREATGGHKYEFRAVGEKRAPHVRVSVPSNQPVLSFYKETMNTAKLVPASLTGSLTWNTRLQQWDVTIFGIFSSYPGFLEIELYVSSRRENIGRYEAVVNLRQEFNITFSIVRTGDLVSEDIVTVNINDSTTSHRLVLASLFPPQPFRTNENAIIAVKQEFWSPWIPVLVILITGTCISVLLIALYVFYYCKPSVRPEIPMSLPKPDLGTTITLLHHPENEQQKKPLTAHSKIVIGVLVVLYLVYALLFTFSAMFGMLHIIQAPYVNNLTIVSNTSAKLQSHVKTLVERMVEYENSEMERLASMTKERFQACNYHLEMAVKHGVNSTNFRRLKTLKDMYLPKGSVQNTIDEYVLNKTNEYKAILDRKVQDFNRSLDGELHELQTEYKAYLKSVAVNSWFSFPKHVFDTQMAIEGSNLDTKEQLGKYFTWLKIEKVQELMSMQDILVDRLSSRLPKMDFAVLLDGVDSRDITLTASSDIRDITLDNLLSHAKYDIPVNNYNFTTVPGDSLFHRHQSNFSESENKGSSNQRLIDSIQGILYPVFISVFLFLDFFLLMYRFSWMLKCIHDYRHGIEEKIPGDKTSSKIHFYKTGKDSLGYTGESFENPYDYYKQNKADIWGDRSELYFLYMHASPKNKEEILRDIWLQKQREKPKEKVEKEEVNCFQAFCRKTKKLLYRLFISLVFWRVVVIFVFVLFMCLVVKATDDLVTIETASFLMDTDAMLPILERQNSVTNSMISRYSSHLNGIIYNYKDSVDLEVESVNSVLGLLMENQNSVLNTVIEGLCNLGGIFSCPENITMETKPVFLTACNFLPVYPQFYTGYHVNMLTDYMETELSPLVLALRSILFNAFYILLIFASIMLVCQIFARVVVIYLLKKGHIRKMPIYQLPSMADEGWQDPQAFSGEKENIYASQSLIAESCESGVYDLTA